VVVLKKKTPPERHAAFSFSVPGTGKWLHLRHWSAGIGIRSVRKRFHNNREARPGGFQVRSCRASLQQLKEETHSDSEVIKVGIVFSRVSNACEIVPRAYIER
jgi:hypothetical protein